MAGTEALDVFFYGLFMDAENLRGKGVSPDAIRIVTARDHVVLLAAKALLLPAPGECAQGVLVTLTRAEIDHLYAGMPEYREIQLNVTLADGSTCAAITLAHAEPPRDAPHDPAYAAAWNALVQRLGFHPASDEASRC